MHTTQYQSSGRPTGVGDAQLRADCDRYHQELSRTAKALEEKITAVLDDLQHRPLEKAHDGMQWIYQGKTMFDSHADQALELISNDDTLKKELFDALFKARHIREVWRFLNHLAAARV